MKEIGERLRDLRRNRGLTQAGLAAAASLGSRHTVSRIERGGRRPTAEELLSALRALNTGIEEFSLLFLDVAGNLNGQCQNRAPSAEAVRP